MIAEIGIMLGVYILARLTPTGWKRVAAALSVLAAILAVVVAVDLGAHGITGRGIASRLLSRPAKAPVVVSEEQEAAPQPAVTTTVTRADGGSITTNLGYGIAVAQDSSLRREWLAVHDTALPVGLEGTPGVTTVYVSKQYGGEYRYRATVPLETRDAVRAVEVRFLTFDVWGNHVRTLSFEQVVDIPANASKTFTGEWLLYSENDVERHYASIAYVARVRLRDGRVVVARSEPVVEAAREFSEKFTAEDLEPNQPRPERPGGASKH